MSTFYVPSVYDFNTGTAFKAAPIACEIIEFVGKVSAKIKIKGFYKDRINPVITVRKKNLKGLLEVKDQPVLRNFYEVEKEPAEVDPS